MKVLWVGDAVVSSGFARCTHAACDALHAAGHEVRVLGMNYFGDPHRYPYPIHPCVQPLDEGRDYFGVGRLPHFVARYVPDVVVLLNDPWNVPAYLDALKQYKVDVPVVAWLAVDACNQPAHRLNELRHVIVWTQFAVDELRRGGYLGDASIVPLGVDAGTFRPRQDREACRRELCPELGTDDFIVGVVGRNQPRKRLDLTLAYFNEWIRSHQIDNAYLLMHVAPTGDRGFDIGALVNYYGIRGRVKVSMPDIGVGFIGERLSMMYNAFDVYLTTTQGEGWGLPALEAMACGVPVIAPDWSGLGCWARQGAHLVGCTSTAISAPINSMAYTIGGVPDRQGTIRALNLMYVDRAYRQRTAESGYLLSKRYQWSSVGAAFVETLTGVMAPQQVAV